MVIASSEPERSSCKSRWPTIWLLIAGCLCACREREASLAVGSDAQVSRPPAIEPTARQGEDWPVFLGPRETGVSGETGIADKWPADGPPVVWETKIGTGYGAPSILGDRLVFHHRPAGREEVVECLQAANGEHQWQYAYRSDFRDPYGYNNGPRCTPLLTENRCYTFGAEGMLLCLDLQSGEKIWSRNTQQDFNVPRGFFGVSCTPILEGDLLIVLVGGQPNSGVVAFHADSGDIAWESVGRETWDGVETGNRGQPRYKWSGDEMIVSYASPLVAAIHGRRQILCLTRQGLVSLDSKDGSVNFKYWFRSRVYESVNAARPVVIGDRIFISAAYRTGSALLKVNADGKGYEVLWRDRRNMLAHWSTPIHVDGFLYGFSGRHEQEGRLRCLEVGTGKVVWETTGFEQETSHLRVDRGTGRIVDQNTGKAVPFPYYGRGSKIQVEDKFIVLGERGTLALVKIDPKGFREISRTSYQNIQHPSWTAPVLSRKRLYLRDEDTLLCVDVGKPRPQSESSSSDNQ